MPGATVAICKFVGVISLGLLTGVSYTTSTQSLPSLLHLPSASTAHTTFLHLQALTKSHLRTLSAVAITSFSLAFALSPPRGGRHPYLLWTSLVVALGSGGADYLLRHDEKWLREQTDEDGAGVNGEVVERAMGRFRAAETARACVSGLAFAMGVVGIWGDGLGARRPAMR